MSGRRCLVAGAVLGGGLVLGFVILRARASADAQPGLAPNAWLHISPDGSVAVKISQTEMGQGISTGLALESRS